MNDDNGSTTFKGESPTPDDSKGQIIELVIRVVTLNAPPGRRRINVGTISFPERFLSRRMIAVLCFIAGNLTGDRIDFAQIMGLLAL